MKYSFSFLTVSTTIAIVSSSVDAKKKSNKKGVLPNNKRRCQQRFYFNGDGSGGQLYGTPNPPIFGEKECGEFPGFPDKKICSGDTLINSGTSFWNNPEFNGEPDGFFTTVATFLTPPSKDFPKVPGARTSETGTFVLGEDELQYSGYVRFQEDEDIYAIAGGIGKYRGARGDIIVEKGEIKICLIED